MRRLDSRACATLLATQRQDGAQRAPSPLLPPFRPPLPLGEGPGVRVAPP